MKIPFAPPLITDDVISEVTETLRSGWITTGPKVRALEEEVTRYMGCGKTLCVNSATSALTFMLHWFGVGKGDEIIVPAFTYCATALAAIHLGAKPIMVDVGKDFNIDVNKVKDAITEKTKVIIPVDNAGFPCDYDELHDLVNSDEIKAKFKPSDEVQKKLGRILILADSAHSFGAEYKGRMTGGVADINIFSFHAVKNLTTSEGGAICFNLPEPFDNEKEYTELRPLTLNGQTKDAFTKTVGNSWKYDVEKVGFKINMPDVCAAIGLAQFRNYGDVLKKRREIFDFYSEKLSGFEWAVIPPYRTDDKLSSCHVFLLRFKGISEAQRDAIIDKMNELGVSVNVHFVPLPMLTLFKGMGYNIENFPQSHSNYFTELSLPVYPQLIHEELEYVTESLITAYNSVVS